MVESEKFQILKLVQDDKVSAEEGARLLQAVEQRGAGGSTSAPAKWLRVRVQAHGNLVNINLPIALLDMCIHGLIRSYVQARYPMKLDSHGVTI
ncbi:MAG: hypothetical protein KGZ50_02900 [Peptococcaceae bacterium]|nr:hypothetical protein [Peptococcaceae bacterium]